MIFGYDAASILQRRRVGHDGNGSRPRRLVDHHSRHDHTRDSRQVSSLTLYQDGRFRSNANRPRGLGKK